MAAKLGDQSSRLQMGAGNILYRGRAAAHGDTGIRVDERATTARPAWVAWLTGMARYCAKASSMPRPILKLVSSRCLARVAGSPLSRPGDRLSGAASVVREHPAAREPAEREGVGGRRGVHCLLRADVRDIGHLARGAVPVRGHDDGYAGDDHTERFES